MSLCISAALMAGAADFYGAGYDLTLEKGQANVYSGLLNAKQVKYKGGNSKSSSQDITLKVKRRWKGMFFTDKDRRIDPGESFEEYTSSMIAEGTDWELSLHASGVGKNAEGWDTMATA